MESRPIHFADSKAQFVSMRNEILAAITRVLESGRYILGEEVRQFESAFAAWVGSKYCISVANGTDALVIALRASGIGQGDEVITVSHSAVATTAAIEQVGAVPVFVDIESSTRCMNAGLVQEHITDKTRAIIPVHIYGHPANMPELVALAKKNGLVLLEDCAQAHGAQINSKQVGTFGDISAFSFYPTKNLGALGDGGAILTNDDKLAEQAKVIRQYGWAAHYISSVAGQNSRLDELQAAVLLAKLPYLTAWNARRRELAALYVKELEGIKALKLPRTSDGYTHAMHLFVVEVEQREELRNYLAGQQIYCGVHYPLAIHQQPAYKARIRGADNLPITEKLYQQILTLPLYPELQNQEVERVCQAIKDWSQSSALHKKKDPN